MRQPLVIGNWKMNGSLSLTSELLSKIDKAIDDKIACDIGVCVPFVYIDRANELVKKSAIKVGAQTVSEYSSGAYTGEISAQMLAELGCHWVLVGHSERRTLFNESDDFLKQKVDAALKNNIEVIFCCGESLEIRESANPEDFVTKQLHASLFHLSKEEIQKCMIAYEPIWAIGTGKVANEDQISKMHTAIRNELKSKYGQEIANEISILYGGSCN
ncbi:MAG TPA: triose-phosphate isomerase, partial [Methylococcaceae bacterium]|nr:triose-phosphate isomerase [Methylococcaceae bacterium]